MSELRDATGQTVNLAVLEGADVVFVAIVRGEPTSKPLARIGGRLPAHATALGKAILAFSPPGVVERIIQGGLEVRTPHTISEPSALLRELMDIRRLGVATEKEECANDRACAASPILGHGGAPIAAISVAGSVVERGSRPRRSGRARRGHHPESSDRPSRDSRSGTGSGRRGTGWVRIAHPPRSPVAGSQPAVSRIAW